MTRNKYDASGIFDGIVKRIERKTTVVRITAYNYRPHVGVGHQLYRRYLVSEKVPISKKSSLNSY